MKITDLYLPQAVTNWSMRRASRVREEKLFEKFTGLIQTIEMHVPYTEWVYVFDMIKKAKAYKGKKILVSGGDSLNLDMLSFFYHKGGSKTTPMEELAILIRFFKEAQKVYDHIIFLESNHETRLKKFIISAVPDRQQATEVIKLVKSLREIFDENKLDKIIYPNDFFFQIGDAIFSHFECNSGVPGSVARQIIQYLTPRIKKEWKVCYQHHTHTQLKMPIDGKTVVETGACIDTLDYWRSGKLSGKGKMSSIGYAEGIMKKGVIDVNSANFVLCGWEGSL